MRPHLLESLGENGEPVHADARGPSMNATWAGGSDVARINQMTWRLKTDMSRRAKLSLSRVRMYDVGFGCLQDPVISTNAGKLTKRRQPTNACRMMSILEAGAQYFRHPGRVSNSGYGAWGPWFIPHRKPLPGLGLGGHSASGRDSGCLGCGTTAWKPVPNIRDTT